MYKLTGRIFDGANLAGFEVEDDNKVKSKLPLNKVKELLRNKEVHDFYLVELDDTEYILGNGALQVINLPVKSMQGNLEFMNRVIEDGHVASYRIKSLETGKEMVLSKSKTWELCFYNQVRGLRAYIKKDTDGKLRKVLIAN